MYADRKSAVTEMEALVFRLRKAPIKKLYKNTDDPLTPELTFFGKSRGVGPSLAPIGELDSIADLLTKVKASATGNTYRIIAYEAVPLKEQTDLKDYPAELLTDSKYWIEAGSSLLHISNDKSLRKIKPNLGGQINPTIGPCAQIFNALQPFATTDISLFRGRKRETEEVYSLLKGSPLLLLYGPSRVGKTSLLQCGLANKLKKDNADLIMVSCSEGAVFNSLDTALQVQLTKVGNGEVLSATDPLALAQQLSQATDRVQYLVFDQVEDVLKADVFDADRIALLGFINNLIASEPDKFRVILSLREEYLAPLAEQEKHLPNLLNHRFRLLPLRESSMVNASINFLDFLKGSGQVDVDDSKAVAERICRDLADENGNVSAHCLQIYLHQVHQKSCQETDSGPVPINTELLDRFGPPQTVIDEYYTGELNYLDQQRDENDPQDILIKHQIDELQDGRRDCGCKEKSNTKTVVAAAPVGAAAGMGWLAALLLLPIGAFLGWFLLPSKPSPPPSACELIEAQTGDCAAYVNYLCTYGDSTGCVPAWTETTDLEDCEVWRDYSALKRRPGCTTYQSFFYKYKDQGVCMDFIQPRLLEWECPLVVDTVQLTVRDTLIQRVPVGSGAVPTMAGSTPTIASPPCQNFGTTKLKSVGPLLIMTDNLPGGPFRWEDALTACSEKGLRLPCIGEIDFLIEKIYRDDPDLAYGMLTGTDACSLIDPAEIVEGRIEFWTATEANDATAWSYFFDTGLKTIGRQSGTPKSARLPCLCVKKDPQQRGSSLPACYGKQLDRDLE